MAALAKLAYEKEQTQKQQAAGVHIALPQFSH